MSLPPTSFVGISKFSESFQTLLERSFTVANLPVSNLQTEQTILQSRQLALGSLEGNINNLRSVFDSLGLAGAQGTVAVSSSNPAVATVTRTGTPEPIDFNLSVTSAADRARETSLNGLADNNQTALSADGVYNLTLGGSTETYSLLTVGFGRAAGTTGSATPSPKPSVEVSFSSGLSGSITAELDSFFVGAAAPETVGAGDTVSVIFASLDGSINASIVTAGLAADADATAIAAALNDQIAATPALDGKVSFTAVDGKLKLLVSDSAGVGFNFTSSSTGTAVTGLESGGRVGGQSAQEVAAALNAQVALNANLTAAGVRFSAYQGEVRIEGNSSFQATVADNDQGTGFASGLAGVQSVAGFANTLTGLRDAINAGPQDVTATILNLSDDPNAPDYRLVVSNNRTGYTTLTLTDSLDADLLTGDNQGVDAVFSVNGVQVVNAGNTITDFAPGLSLTIVGAGSATVSASNDVSGVATKLSELAEAYNTVAAALNAQVGENAGSLSGDIIVRQAQSLLRSISSYAGSGEVRSIADLGLELSSEGLMSFNSLRFTQTAGNFQAVREFLGSTTTGFSGTVRRALVDFADPATGQIRRAVSFIRESDASLSAQIVRLQERIDLQMAQMEAQFAAADTLLSQLESQQDLLTQLFSFQFDNNNRR